MKLSTLDLKVLKTMTYPQPQAPKKSARRLKISKEEFLEIRERVRPYLEDYKKNPQQFGNVTTTQAPSNSDLRSESFNLDRGEGQLSLVSDRPLSPEEIEEKFKIDKNKWRLSAYWNKEKPGGGFFVSANIIQLKATPEDQLKALLKEFKFKYQPVTRVHINTQFTDPTCAVLSLQDIHVAKQTMDKLDTVENDVKATIEKLILRSYHSCFLDKIVFVLGGDLVNMDTFTGTTTAGTPVENNNDAMAAYRTAFELMFWSVNYLKQFCNELEVVYIPGNHSRLTEAHIAYSLSRVIDDPTIKWNIDYEERKVIEYGTNMICLEHGDFDTKKSFFVFATEYAQIWGRTTYRVVYTGHHHKEKKVEYTTVDEINGFTLKILPSLSKTDGYHHSNKWTGNKRGGVIELLSKESGPIGSWSHFFRAA
jgi:hypothetical protein